MYADFSLVYLYHILWSILNRYSVEARAVQRYVCARTILQLDLGSLGWMADISDHLTSFIFTHINVNSKEILSRVTYFGRFDLQIRQNQSFFWKKSFSTRINTYIWYWFRSQTNCGLWLIEFANIILQLISYIIMSLVI